MTDSAKKAPKSASAATTAAIGTMNALGPMGETAQKICVDMGNETMQFIAARVQHISETQKAMLTCTNLADIQKVQADFSNQAMEAYRAQALRIMEIMSVGAPKGLDGAPLMTRRDYDDVPL